MTPLRLLVLGAGCLLVTGCATTRPSGPAAEMSPPPRAPITRSAPPPAPSTTPPATSGMTGQASWYGEAHHGKKTASGEPYDRTQLTAAHRTLPLGTRVRVTNVENGRSVVVRINDRGPFKGGRIIDLSQAAARAIGAIGDGVVSVRLEVLEDSAAEPAPAAGSR